MSDLNLGERLWRSAITCFHDWQHRRALEREFVLFDQQEGERVLRDSGMSRNDFLALLQTPLASQDLLSPALSSLGIDPAALHTEWTRDLARTCIVCKNRRQCRDDLSAHRFSSRYRGYCPNSDSLEVIAGRMTAGGRNL